MEIHEARQRAKDASVQISNILQSLANEVKPAMLEMTTDTITHSTCGVVDNYIISVDITLTL